MQLLKNIWDFSRPHTIVGSLLSIAAWYLISLAIAFPEYPLLQAGPRLSSFGLTLLSALSCNVFITGLNQVVDIPLDKINKPWLPIPSGRLSRATAIRIVAMSGGIALLTAGLGSTWLLGLIATIMLVGALYSLPPIQLKRHHLSAAFCILLVRGVLVNAGMPLHFLYLYTGKAQLPPDVWPVVLFVTLFSIGIAWFKDIPDTQGDAAHQIHTLALKTSPATALQWGRIMVVLAFLLLMLMTAWQQLRVNLPFVVASQSILLVLFVRSSYQVQLAQQASIQKFYMRFWGFFFAAYILIPLGYFL